MHLKKNFSFKNEYILKLSSIVVQQCLTKCTFETDSRNQYWCSDIQYVRKMLTKNEGIVRYLH